MDIKLLQTNEKKPNGLAELERLTVAIRRQANDGSQQQPNQQGTSEMPMSAVMLPDSAPTIRAASLGVWWAAC
jgi:hypothetical protein